MYFMDFNPLSRNSVENEISLTLIIISWSNNQVRRIKKVITKDEMS